jgi:hypothetical protein
VSGELLLSSDWVLQLPVRARNLWAVLAIAETAAAVVVVVVEHVPEVLTGAATVTMSTHTERFRVVLRPVPA